MVMKRPMVAFLTQLLLTIRRGSRGARDLRPRISSCASRISSQRRGHETAPAEILRDLIQGNAR
jgi:hypothetical protein